ncbi:hypothetical protein DH86_00002970 [Scytalidium sp. 3C]|nr:hypothetical protein DH86_00002970 [Scytalidium sp. 3C]
MNQTYYTTHLPPGNAISVSNVIAAVGVLIAIWTVSWIIKLIRWRLAYKKMVGSLKTPPFSFAIGTIPGMVELAKVTPSATHPHGLMTMLQRKYNLDNLFLLDNYPVSGERQLVIADPGAEWKKTRALFNPGFSVAHLSTLIPSIVDDTAVFVNNLAKHADAGDIFPIEEEAAHLTIDIMGHVVLDHDLNSQTQKNELVEAFRKAISWTPPTTTVNPFIGLNPIRPIMYKYYGAKLDGYIGRVLDARFESNLGREVKAGKRKPAIDLALDEYVAQQKENGVQVRGLDATFKSTAIDQMKTFLFAGHDTSSSTISYAYYLLHLHPESLENLRKELNEVFPGRNAAEMIKENPNLVNKLPYTLAVIKGTSNTSYTADGKRYVCV